MSDDIKEKESISTPLNKSIYNRTVVAVMISMIAFLYSLGYDEPGSLQVIIQNTFHIQTYQFEYLYSLYSFPNAIFCFINGILLDKILGIKLGTFIFALMAVVGQMISTLGGFMINYWVMLLGRILYGLGAESLSVLLNYFVVVWFLGKEINFINALYAGFLKLGTATVFLFSLPLYESFKNHKLGFTLIIFIVIAVIILLLSNLLYYITAKRTDMDKFSNNGNIKLSTIIKLPVTFWFTVIIIALQTGCVVSFVSISQEYFQTKYNLSLNEANQLSSFYNLIGGISPVLPGFIADLIGYDLYMVLFGGVLGVVSNFLFIFTNLSPYLPLTLFAFSYGIINTVCWAIVAFVVESYQLATAFGVIFSLCDLANSVFPIITGIMVDKYGPDSIFILFQICFVLCLLLMFLTIFFDRRHNKILVMSKQERNIYFEHIDDTKQCSFSSQETVVVSN